MSLALSTHPYPHYARLKGAAWYFLNMVKVRGSNRSMERSRVAMVR